MIPKAPMQLLAIPAPPRDNPDSPTLPVLSRKRSNGSSTHSRKTLDSNASATRSTSARSQAPPKVQRKAVSFNGKARVRCVLPRSKYTEDERRSSWYSEDEFAAIMEDIRSTVAMLTEFPDNFDEDDFCPRGLEKSLSAEGRRSVNRNREKGLNAVLDEQDRQLDMAKTDPTAVARAYVKATRHCRCQAQAQALRDQIDAKATLKSISFQ